MTHPLLKTWRRVAGAALFALGVSSASGAGEFSMAGGNPQRTSFVDASGPLTEPEVAWETALSVPGESATQPIVDDQGNLYVTGAPVGGENLPDPVVGKGALVSLDRQGRERWRYAWTWNPADPAQRGSTSQLSVPVLAPGRRIVMGFRFGWLRCFDRDSGALVWERNLSEKKDPITSAPVIDRDGYLYVYVRDTLVLTKIDSATGKPVWAQPFPDGGKGNASSPALSHDQKTVYIERTGNSVGYLYAFDAGTGMVRWAWSPESAKYHSFAWRVPLVDGRGVVHIQDEEDARLYAIRDLGPVHAVAWVYKRPGTGAPRLAAADETRIYSSYTDAHPVIVALNLDGTEAWTRRIDIGKGVGGMLVTKTALYFAVDGTGQVFRAESPVRRGTLEQKRRHCGRWVQRRTVDFAGRSSVRRSRRNPTPSGRGDRGRATDQTLIAVAGNESETSIHGLSPRVQPQSRIPSPMVVECGLGSDAGLLSVAGQRRFGCILA